jgi:hypothetical protein
MIQSKQCFALVSNLLHFTTCFGSCETSSGGTFFLQKFIIINQMNASAFVTSGNIRDCKNKKGKAIPVAGHEGP